MGEAQGHKSSLFSMKNPLATKSLYIGNAGGWRVANNSMMIIQILLSIAKS